jgi:hypothetical protein
MGSGRAVKLWCRWTRGGIAGLASGRRGLRRRCGHAMKRSATWPICPLALCGSCAGRPLSTLWHLAAHSGTASTSHPSKDDGGTLKRGTDAYLAPTLDNAATSNQWSASPPSPLALCGHPRRCVTIPGTAAPSPALWEPRTTRHHHTRCCTSYGLPSAAPLSQRTDGDQTGSSHTATLEGAPRRIQDSPRRPTGTRFVRTTINSTALSAMPPYVALRTVRHDCKPPPLGL